MYRREMWKDGWLWVQHVPNGKWHKATEVERITALVERVARLEQAMEQKS